MWTPKIQESLRSFTVLPEPMLFAHMSTRPRGNFLGDLRRQVYTMKEWFHGKSKEPISRNVAQVLYKTDQYLEIKCVFK